MENKPPTVRKIFGPFVVAENMQNVKLYEIVKIGKNELVGEIVRIENSTVHIVLYAPVPEVFVGDTIKQTGKVFLAELGPGLLRSIYDGTQQKFHIKETVIGYFLEKETEKNALDPHKKWDFVAIRSVGDFVNEGEVLGSVQEAESILHKIMVPAGIFNAKIKKINSGHFKISDSIAVLETQPGKEILVSMRQYWPIRVPRNIFPKISVSAKKDSNTEKSPILPSSNKFDIPKNVANKNGHTFPIVVQVHCETSETETIKIFEAFSANTSASSQRAIIIAQTKSSPIAMRKISAYLGMTIAEYYRDMGYPVLLKIDSILALTQSFFEQNAFEKHLEADDLLVSAKLKMAAFYDRAGSIEISRTEKETVEGSITLDGNIE